MLKLDRVLFTSTHYPANYGFIPRTFADDGDPLDVLVLCSETIQPMTLVECKPIGVLNMVDNDSCDEKLLQFPLTIPTTIATATSANFQNIILKKFSTFSRFTKPLRLTRLLR